MLTAPAKALAPSDGAALYSTHAAGDARCDARRHPLLPLGQSRARLDAGLDAERLYAHPNVRMDVGRVALRRGPLIYCVEEADNPGGPVQRLTLPRDATLRAERAQAFGGVTMLKSPAKELVSGDEGALYSTTPPVSRDATLAAIPYFLWANREPGSMTVWIAEARA